jgi:hypothetical protein
VIRRGFGRVRLGLNGTEWGTPWSVGVGADGCRHDTRSSRNSHIGSTLGPMTRQDALKLARAVGLALLAVLAFLLTVVVWVVRGTARFIEHAIYGWPEHVVTTTTGRGAAYRR